MAKDETLTFKVDASLLAALKGIPNRSSFIRNAILTALDSACPLCSGTGVLNPQRRDHWAQFARTHHIQECPDCHEVHLACSLGPDDDAQEHGSKHR